MKKWVWSYKRKEVEGMSVSLCFKTKDRHIAQLPVTMAEGHLEPGVTPEKNLSGNSSLLQTL